MQRQDLIDRQDLIIGGRPHRASGAERLTVVNPATEQVVGHAPSATPDEVDLAVAAATQADRAGPWRHWSIEDRVAVVEAMCASLEPRLEEVLALVTDEMGVPIRASRPLHRDMAIGSVRHACAAARRIVVEERRDGAVDALVRLEPTGVVAAIAPWNGPFLQALYKIVYPLLAGCPVVFKPAPETPLDAFVVAEALAEAGLPPGVLSVVTGGPEVGEQLVGHDDVDAVFFTGSTPTGRAIGAVCGASMKRAVLELGGKSAAVVLDDADLDVAVPALVSGGFGNTGQNCAATSRVLVARSRHDEVVDALVEAARGLVVGDPRDEATTLGPLVSARQRDKVEAHVARALADCARAPEPGGRPADLPRGWFLRPTVLSGVDNRDAIAQEEVFGPVVCVIGVDAGSEDPDGALVAAANDSAYGLHGSVFSADDDRALAVARGVRTGTFSINGFLLNSELPFGGVKASGVGRKYSVEGIREFMEIKTVNFARSGGSFSMK